MARPRIRYPNPRPELNSARAEFNEAEPRTLHVQSSRSHPMNSVCAEFGKVAIPAVPCPAGAVAPATRRLTAY
jgi:hypothetical protein